MSLGGEELTNGKAAGKLPLSENVAIFSRNALKGAIQYKSKTLLGAAQYLLLRKRKPWHAKVVATLVT